MRRLKKHVLHCVVPCILLFGVLPVANAGKVETIDRVVAVVNDEVISLFDLNQFAAPQVEKLESVGYPEDRERIMRKQLMSNLVEQLIDKKLADQESRRIGIHVSDKEIEATIRRIKKSYDYTDEELEESLIQQETSLEEFREHWRERLLMSKLVNREIKSKIIVTDTDIKNYYEAHAEKYAGEKQYHLRCIIMKVPPGAEKKEIGKIRERMDAVMAELESGKPFPETAGKYSESFASEGGDIGFFKPEKLSPEIREVIRKLPRGSHTDILETDLGYQIYYVENIVFSQTRTLEEVSREIEEVLYRQGLENRYRTWLKNLREQAHIRVVERSAP